MSHCNQGLRYYHGLLRSYCRLKLATQCVANQKIVSELRIHCLADLGRKEKATRCVTNCRFYVQSYLGPITVCC
jgi:hypothetical protein